MISGDHGELSLLNEEFYMYDLNSWKVKSPTVFFGRLAIVCMSVWKKIIAAVFGNTNEGGFLKGFVSWPLSTIME